MTKRLILLAALCPLVLAACGDSPVEPAEATTTPAQARTAYAAPAVRGAAASALALAPAPSAPPPMQALEQRIARLESMVAGGSIARATVPQAPQLPDATGTVDAAQERMQRRAELDASFRSEVAQAGWATSQVAAFRQLLASSEHPLTVQSLECRSKSCRMAVTDEGPATQLAFSQLAMQLSGKFASIHVAQGAGANESTILYFNQ